MIDLLAYKPFLSLV